LKLAAWYHAYVDGDWTEPVLEHVDALLAADFSGPVYLGLVGASMWRGAARDAFDPLDVRVAVEADSGFEQVTLAKVREYAQTHDGAVLYAHTKGAADASEFRKQWRRSMTRRVVSDWRANLAHLEHRECEECGGRGMVHFGEVELDTYAEGERECSECGGEGHVGLDAVGCHWLTAEQFPWAAQEFPEGTPFFGGNFWMARCDYLRRLPEPSTRSRFDAERWIGLRDPKVLDLNPGWPAASLFV
jgi:hypothetical protein